MEEEKPQANYSGPFRACAVAKHMLDKNAIPTRFMGKTKLIKLVCIAYGWVLGKTEGEHKLFVEGLEAWDYGPVVRDLYGNLKSYSIAQGNAAKDYLEQYAEEAKRIEGTSEAEIIGEVLVTYQNNTAYELTELTHRPGSPWHTTTSNGDLHIPDDIITDFYMTRFHEN